MQYEIQVETLSPSRRRLNFTLGQGEVTSELDRAFLDLKRKVRLPGFRPGKVPRKLLEARYGKQIEGEVSGRLIDRAWREAARDLDVAGQPALEDQGELSRSAVFSFSIAVDVKPEVEITDYRGVTVTYASRAVSEDDVDKRVQSRLAGRARLVEVTDGRGAQVGDLVLCAVKLEADGETVADEPGTMITMAGDRYYPGLESLVAGLAVGGDATGEITIGDTSAYEALRGSVVQATINVQAIQANEVPELDDEIAKELEFEGGAAGMRAAIRMEIESAIEDEGRTQARIALLQKLVVANEFDVPEGMIGEQLEALTEELKVRRAYAGEDPRKIRFSEAELADLRGRAVFAAKASVILAAVARQEEIDASNSDLDAKVDEIANLRGQTVEAIRGYLEREDAMPVLRTRILEEKTLEWLLENANLVVTDVVDTPAEAAAPAEATEATEATEAPAWNKSMKKADLLAVAKTLGLDLNTKNKKNEIVAALEAATA